MKKYGILLLLFCASAFAQDPCAYLENISFTDFYARLVNRGPNMLTAYGTVTNNDDAPHTLVGVSTPEAQTSLFREYRQTGGAGDITAQPVSSIEVPNGGGAFTWYLGGPHIALLGFTPKAAGKLLQFGTSFDPNQTVPLTFKFSDGCTYTLPNVPIRDRMQS